jgi:pilus assembly protein Flp/PilA
MCRLLIWLKTPPIEGDRAMIQVHARPRHGYQGLHSVHRFPEININLAFVMLRSLHSWLPRPRFLLLEPRFHPTGYAATDPQTTKRSEGAKLKDFANSIKRFLVSEDGPTAVEYAVMLALIIVVCLTAIQAVGTNANNKFNAVQNALT